MNYPKHTPNLGISKVLSKNTLPPGTRLKADPIQCAALDYHVRGLNVFPAPSYAQSEAARALGEHSPTVVKELYNNRLHDHTGCCPESCGRRHPSFESLFDGSNIAVMCGRTSGNLVAIVCRGKSAFYGVENGLLEQRALYWAYRIENDGGVFLLRLKEGEPLTDDATIADESGIGRKHHISIVGWKHYILLPPSIGPDGTTYLWHPGCGPKDRWPEDNAPDGGPPFVHAGSVTWLGIQLRQKPIRHYEPVRKLDKKYHCLSHKNQLFLKTGEADNTYDACFNLACDLAGNGFSERETHDLLLDLYRGRYKTLERLIKHAYSEERKPARRAFDQPYQETYEKLKAWAAGYQWAGRTRHTDRRVFEVLLRRMLMDKSETFRAAKRELADMTGLAEYTCQTSLQRLTGEKESNTPVILTRCSTTELGASLFRFNLKSKYFSPVLHSNVYTSDNKSNGNSILVSNDSIIDSYTGLEYLLLTPKTAVDQDFAKNIGLTQFKVWKCICLFPELKTLEAIGDKLSMSKQAVWQSVQKLRKLNMIEKTDGYWCAEPFTQEDLETFNLARVDCFEKARLMNLKTDDPAKRIKEVPGYHNYAARQQYQHVRERELKINKLLSFLKTLRVNQVKRYGMIQEAKRKLSRKNATVKGKG